MNQPSDRGAGPPAMPWDTAPTGLGAHRCDWCGRDIHAPALPCSATGGSGLATAVTAPGAGARCKWEWQMRGLDPASGPH